MIQDAGRMKADLCMISGINYGGPDSESEDDEIPNPQPYGLPLDMLANETFSEVASYDRPLRVDVLDNFALLEMIEGWQKIARQVGNDYVLAHPQCQAVLKEMYVRGMVNTAGIWLVDPDQVDMKFVRVTRS